jgi:hypothetical protein
LASRRPCLLALLMLLACACTATAAHSRNATFVLRVVVTRSATPQRTVTQTPSPSAASPAPTVPSGSSLAPITTSTVQITSAAPPSQRQAITAAADGSQGIEPRTDEAPVFESANRDREAGEPLASESQANETETRATQEADGGSSAADQEADATVSPLPRYTIEIINY